MRIDPDGNKWKTTKDREIAESLLTAIRIKMAKYEAKYERFSRKAEALEARGKMEKSYAMLNKAVLFKAGMENLQKSYKELEEMGSESVEQKFTFEKGTINTDGTYENYTYKDGDNEIVMQYITQDDQVHEAYHGFEIYKGGYKQSGDQHIQGELGAYSRQYSFNPASLPESTSSVFNLTDIDRNWLKGTDGYNDLFEARAQETKRKVIKLQENIEK